MSTVKLDDVLKYEQPTKYIVESVNYKEIYETPVLTAGKSFLLGYTDEQKGVFTDVPVIIFDDFTTAFHYVDFPFKVKSSAMKILKPVKEKADIKYLFYKMQTISMDTDLHKRYWISKYSQVQIPLPPLPQQQKIANILDAADALRQNDKALIEKYDELTQSLFLDMFGDIGRNLNNFPVVKLDEVCSKITDGEHGTVERLESGKLYLMARNIRENYIDFSDVSFISEGDHKKIFKRCNAEKGDLLLVCVGATIGRACITPDVEEFSLARSVALLKPSEKINSLYLYTAISSKYIQEVIKRSGNSSAQAGLYTGKIKEIQITLPPKELQNQFADRVAIIEEQKAIAQKSLEKSEELFNSLLQKAFNGELI